MTRKLFWKFFSLGVLTAWHSKIVVVSQAVFLVALLMIFTALWRAAAVGGLSNAVEPGQYVWYLLVTELVICGTPHIHRTVQESLHSGEYQGRLVSPLSHTFELFARGLGETTVRILVLLMCGSAATLLFSDGTFVNGWGFIASLALVPLSATILLAFYFIIGLASPWIGDVRPIYWFVQKTIFLFGGLLTPLTLYPPLLQKVAYLTPCAPLLFGIGQHVLALDPVVWLLSLFLLLVWGAVAVCILRWQQIRVDEYILSGRIV